MNSFERSFACEFAISMVNQKYLIKRKYNDTPLVKAHSHRTMFEFKMSLKWY